MSAGEEEDFLPQCHKQNEEESDADEEENDYSWKCKLLEFIQQYPEVYDKASPKVQEEEFARSSL